MLHVELVVSGSGGSSVETRLPVALELDVARAPEIWIGVGFRQKTGIVVVAVAVVLRPRDAGLAELDGDDGHRLDGIAAVARAALVERGVLK